MKETNSLHWFGLTDSWYWLQCGKDELFRYSDEALAFWTSRGDPSLLSYVDYQVVRLWEDIQDILLNILEPIPEAILQKIKPSLEAMTWRQQLADKIFPDTGEISEEMEKLFNSAADWFDNYRLCSNHLRECPCIWFWNDGTSVFVRWDNTGRQFEGHPAWSSDSGTISMPISSFVEEIRSFDHRLISAMQQRIDEVLKHWPHPDVHINKEQLVSEHQDRAQWMSRSFARAKEMQPTPWSEILSAIETLENKGFPLPLT